MISVVSAAPPEEPSADPRGALIREQAELLGEQERRLAAQAEQIAALEAMVADLREQLEAAERAGEKRKCGKQPGSPGASMTWQPGPDRGPLPGRQLLLRP